MTAAGAAQDFDTVILAGGGAARMGGADKPGLAVGGAPMLVSVATAAVAAGTRKLVIVGPPRTGPISEALTALAAGLRGGLTVVREDPPGGGPVPALRRGLAEVTAPALALLAADLPFLTGRQLIAVLTAASGAGAVLIDETGRPQWLAGGWQADPLRTALASYGGNSLRGLLAPLDPGLVRLEVPAGAAPPWLDCDTPDDLAAAGLLANPNGAA